MNARANATTVAIGALATVVLAIAILAGRTDSSNTATDDAARAQVFGLREDLSFEELVEASDAVVMGTPVAVTQHRFVDNESVTVEERRDPIVAKGSYNEFEVTVARYLKGEGPESIAIRTLADHNEFRISGDVPPEPQVGVQQLFLLFTGEGVWEGSSLILTLGTLGDGQIRFEPATPKLQYVTISDAEALFQMQLR